MKKFDVITIFPGIFESFLNESLLARAINKKLISIRAHNLRGWTNDAHKTVDDRPYGGGAGMGLKIEPIFRAVKSLTLRQAQGRRGKKKGGFVSAQGKK